jgi:hypothetical protein
MTDLDWRAIIIHHSDTKDDGEKADWEVIRKFHTSFRHGGDIVSEEEAERFIADGEEITRPWSDIGYHWGIESVKGEIVVQKGRALDKIGAHCVGKNVEAIGICCVGDYDNEHPSDAVYYNCAELCVQMMRLFPKIKPSTIYPHNKFSEKTCPGLLFDMSRLDRYIRCGMAQT